MSIKIKYCTNCAAVINPHSRYKDDAEVWEYNHCLTCRRKIKRKKRIIKKERAEIKLSDFNEIKKLADEIFETKIGELN